MRTSIERVVQGLVIPFRDERKEGKIRKKTEKSGFCRIFACKKASPQSKDMLGKIIAPFIYICAYLPTPALFYYLVYLALTE